MNRIKTATRTLAAAAILGTGMASAPAFADDAGARPAERLLEQVSGNLRGQAAGDSRYEGRGTRNVDANLNASERRWREMELRRTEAN
jgi:hypothetical protein